MPWWKRLRQVLRDKGLTQADLARLSGVNHARIRKMLSGAVAHPRGDALIEMCRALGVTEQWVLFGDETPRQPVTITHIAFADLRRGLMMRENEALSNGSPRDRGLTARTFTVDAPDGAMAPLIAAGALLHCEVGAMARPGDIVLVYVGQNDLPVIRRYREVAVGNGQTQVTFTPENAAYAEHRIAPGETYNILARITHVLTPL